MNQRRFFGNDFFYKKFAYSASVKIRSRHSLCAEYRVWAKPNKCFEAGFVKNQVQNLRVGTNSPCLLRLQTRKFLCRKITVRFKLNLKTDGLDCKVIFKFGKHIEGVHSTSKQCRRIYKSDFCVAKYLLGTPKPLNCIRWMQDWRLQMRKFMVLTHCQPLVNNFFQPKKKIAMIKDEHCRKM